MGDQLAHKNELKIISHWIYVNENTKYCYAFIKMAKITDNDNTMG